MALLERHILSQLIRPFLLGVFVVTFLLTMDFLFDYLDLFLGKGIPLWTVAQLFGLGLGWMMALSIPCGVLVGVLMTYGRLAQDNEIVAIKASGISPFRAMRPALLVGTVVAGGLVLFHNYVLPDMNHAFANLMLSINKTRPTAEIQEGREIDDFEGYSLFIGDLEDRTGQMEDVIIHDFSRKDLPTRTILAKHGTLVFDPQRNVLNLHLQDGEIHELGEGGAAVYRKLDFARQTLTIQGVQKALERTHRRTRGQREMRIGAMRRQVEEYTEEYARFRQETDKVLAKIGIESVAQLPDHEHRPPWYAKAAELLGHPVNPPPAMPDSFWTPERRRLANEAKITRVRADSKAKQINQYQVEIQKKFSIPFASIIFALVGAPLGVRARRGGLTAGFLSVGFFVFYYLCLIGGEQLADRRYLTPWLSMWLPNIVLGALGVWLTLRIAEVSIGRRRRRRSQN